MSENQAGILARIIIKVRLGNADHQEREILNNWLDESEDNRQLYKKIIRGNAIKNRFHNEDIINNSTDYTKVIKQLSKVIEKKRSKRLFYTILSSVSAASIILFVLFYPTNNKDVKPDKTLNLVATVIDNKVLLITNTGEHFDVKNNNNIFIENDEQKKIKVDDVISYLDFNDTDIESDSIHYLKTPTGEDISIILNDGTRVWMNSVSELEYPVVFKGKERIVKLKGEAYFEVAKDEDREFIVIANDVRTTVHGTSFNVNAYEEQVITTLLTGSVSLTLNHKRGDIPLYLQPNMQGIWDPETESFIRKKVEANKVISWKDGIFIFDEEDLQTVVKTLTRWYGYEFEFRDYDKHTFSGSINKGEKLEDVLQMLTMTGGPQFLIENDKIYVIQKKSEQRPTL